MVEKHKEFVVACLQATEAPRSVVVERAVSGGLHPAHVLIAARPLLVAVGADPVVGAGTDVLPQEALLVRRADRHRVTHASQRRRAGRGQVEREQARPALGPRAVVVRDAVHLLGTRTTNPKARRKTNAYD